jgi:hypothetical protein
MKYLILLLVLVSCDKNTSHDPQSCRERVAAYLGTVYPDPVLLGKALDVICLGQEQTTTT